MIASLDAVRVEEREGGDVVFDEFGELAWRAAQPKRCFFHVEVAGKDHVHGLGEKDDVLRVRRVADNATGNFADLLAALLP